MEKVSRKCAPKASLRPILNFVELPKTAYACKKLLAIF